MTRTPHLVAATLLLGLFGSTAWAQSPPRRSGFDDAPPPNQPYRGDQGFSFQGDQLQPSYDRRHVGQYDNRYSQTYKDQQEAAQKPGGGCLKYGAVGAVGGHYAGHGILGALAGCAVGAEVRHRDKVRIEREQQQR